MTPPTRRKLLRLIFTVAITLIFLLAIELGCRTFYKNRSLYKGHGNPDIPKTFDFTKAEKGRETQIEQLREVARGHTALSIFLGDRFGELPVEPRPDGEQRWFLMGGSAAWGLEVDEPIKISTLLSKRLGGLRVVNAGIPAHNSDDVLFRAIKVLSFHDPTGLIVYSGNNELINWYYPTAPKFLGRDVRPIIQALAKSRAVQLLLDLHSIWMRDRAAKPVKGEYYARRSILDDGYCAEYAYDSMPGFTRESWKETKKRVLDHYERNLSSIVDEAKNAGVPIVLTTVPINPILSPCYFLPQPASMDAKLRGPIRDLLMRGWERIRNGDYQGAERIFAEAVVKDETSALALHGHGVALAYLGDYRSATVQLLEAREETIGYLGSMVSLNKRIRKVAAEKDVPWVDAAERFEQAYASQTGRPGRFWLIQDYCHPLGEGNGIIAGLLEEPVGEAMGDSHKAAVRQH
jgi:hypothetical protein